VATLELLQVKALDPHFEHLLVVMFLEVVFSVKKPKDKQAV
jgi:hypothetical protein